MAGCYGRPAPAKKEAGKKEVVRQEEFFGLVDDSGDGCWNWLGRIDKDGYGRYGRKAAHRVSYYLANPSASQELDIDHTCYNRACVRPSHLEGVSEKVNLERRRK